VYALWSIPNGSGDVDASIGYECKVFSSAFHLHAAFYDRLRGNTNPGHFEEKMLSKTLHDVPERQKTGPELV
jgi:hypothetical protein